VEHPSAAEIEAYARQALAPDRLRAVDGHLTACAPCRERLAAPPVEARLAGVLRRDLDRALAEPEHVDDERLDAWIDGRLAEDEVRRVEAHAAACEPCGRQVEALRAAAAEGATPARLTPARRPAWRTPLAAAALAAAGAALALLVRAPGRLPGPGPSVQPSAAARALEELADGSRRYARNAHGWEGLEGLADAERETLRAALDDGRVPAPDWLARLRPAHAGLLGAAPQERFRVESPVATGVAEAQPRFAWSPLPGARDYVVTVLDAELQSVAASRPLRATTWTPERPLRPGEYVWQVAARGAREEVAPGPGEPEARFRVLTEVERETAAQARARHAGEPLLLGLLLARAGLVDEAGRELARAAAANPESARLARLRAQLASPTAEKAAQ
jgi:hypothetical protein